jgi:putative Holliday junction resolvase
MTRLLAVDHGSRRIGLAVGDTETGMAFARPALRRSRGADAAPQVAEIARREGAMRVIVGLPRNMDGSEGPQAAAARAFGERLAAEGIEVAYLDERLTSWEASRRLAASGRRPRRDSGELDSAAARIILQEYFGAPPQPDPAVEAE